jgi:sortase (surface protein transpeptidase)
VALRIGADSWPVEPIGVDAAQALAIPGSIGTLGWWRDGAKAGSRSGFTVVTGHATHDGGAAANRWWGLERGDRVAVRTAHGSLAYRVTSRTTYGYEDMPYARWFPKAGPGGPPALALITCSDYYDGEWHANTVVEAVPLVT